MYGMRETGAGGEDHLCGLRGEAQRSRPKEAGGAEGRRTDPEAGVQAGIYLHCMARTVDCKAGDFAGGGRVLRNDGKLARELREERIAAKERRGLL